jgi:anti-sigma B factor antagonist
MLLEITFSVVQGHRLVGLRGELDMATAPDVAEAIDAELATSAGPFGVDLTELSFIDSSGVRALVLGARRAENLGRQMFLLTPATNRAVRRVFDLLHLETAVSIVEQLAPGRPGQVSPIDPLSQASSVARVIAG